MYVITEGPLQITAATKYNHAKEALPKQVFSNKMDISDFWAIPIQ